MLYICRNYGNSQLQSSSESRIFPILDDLFSTIWVIKSHTWDPRRNHSLWSFSPLKLLQNWVEIQSFWDKPILEIVGICKILLYPHLIYPLSSHFCAYIPMKSGFAPPGYSVLHWVSEAWESEPLRCAEPGFWEICMGVLGDFMWISSEHVLDLMRLFLGT